MTAQKNQQLKHDPLFDKSPHEREWATELWKQGAFVTDTNTSIMQLLNAPTATAPADKSGLHDHCKRYSIGKLCCVDVWTDHTGGGAPGAQESSLREHVGKNTVQPKILFWTATIAVLARIRRTRCGIVRVRFNLISASPCIDART